MKFDLDTAWKDASRLLRDNFSLLAIIAGVFFFVPYAAVLIAIPSALPIAALEQGGNPEAMQAAILDLYSTYWWVLLALAIIQGIGLLAMLALLRRRANPTVGEALATGAGSVISYLAAQILQSFALIAVIILLIGIPAAAGSPAIAFFGGVLALVLFLYILTKMSLVSPVIAIEEVKSPLTAIARSWKLTRGNSVRVFLFYLLVLVAFFVVSVVASMITTVIFSLGGENAALFGTSFIAALINAALIILGVCLLAAVHTQLLRLQGSNHEDAAGR
jgi:hypothetical protein